MRRMPREKDYWIRKAQVILRTLVSWPPGSSGHKDEHLPSSKARRVHGATEVSSTSLQDRRPLETEAAPCRCSASWGDGGTIEEQRTLRFAPSMGNDKSLWEGGRRIQVKLLRKLHHTDTELLSKSTS